MMRISWKICGDEEGTKVKNKKKTVALRKWRILLWMLAVLLWRNAVLAYAAEDDDGAQAQQTALLQISVDGEDAVAYLECGDGIASAEAQIAQYPCGDVQVSKAQDICVHTIIMVDNSLSVTEPNRDKIKDILRQYVQTMPKQEIVSLAVFGEDIQFLCEESDDTQKMLTLIDEIDFHDQDTYLTDYLYQLLEEIETDAAFTRFIVISDGVDNKTIGITKEELYDRIKEIARPIHTIGHIYKENTEQLKNMFALSRATSGKDMLMEDYDSITPMVDQMHDFSALYACRFPIPEEVKDGANRHVLLKLHTEKGDMEVSGEVPMPFGLVEKEPEEPVTEPVKEPEVIPEPEPVPEAAPKPPQEPVIDTEEANDDGQNMNDKAVIGVLVLVFAVAVYLLYRQKRKSRTVKEKKKPTAPVTVQKPEPMVPEEQEDATVMIEGRYLLTLRDRMDAKKVFRYPLDGRVIVGRSIDMVQIPVDYNQTVSGQHCEFYTKDNHFFVRDMNSANHTYLNGKRIGGAVEIVSGCRVRLGEVEFDVEIMPI